MSLSSLLITALLILQCFAIHSTNPECTGPHHLQPCECALSHFSCKSNQNHCTWAADTCSADRPPSSTSTSTTSSSKPAPATSALTKCAADCNAVNVKLLYYGKLSEYNTDYIYYDTVYLYDQTNSATQRRRRTLSMQANPAPHVLSDSSLQTEADIVCYTYSIAVNKNEFTCLPDIDSVVLGVCDVDTHRVNVRDLEGLVVTEFAGDLYSAYSAEHEMNGLRVNVQVRENSKPVEFTLCMKGINDAGITSNSVLFNRGGRNGQPLSSYTCLNNVVNQGLPCLRDAVVNSKEAAPQSQSGPIFGAETGVVDVDIEHHGPTPHHLRAPSEVFSTFLFTVLLIVLTVMVLVSTFYMCVSHEKSWLHVAVEKYRYSLPASMWTASNYAVNNSTVYESGKESAAAVSSSDISFSSSSMEFEDDDDDDEHRNAGHPQLPHPKVPDESPTSMKTNSNNSSVSSSALSGLGRISLKWSNSAPNLFKFNLKRKKTRSGPSALCVERQRLLQQQYMKLYQEDEVIEAAVEEHDGNLLARVGRRAVDDFTDDDDDDEAEMESDASGENLAQSIKAIERQVVREMNERMNSFRGEVMQEIPESPHEHEHRETVESVHVDVETATDVNPEAELAEIVNVADPENEHGVQHDEEEKEEILYAADEEETAGQQQLQQREDMNSKAVPMLLGSPELMESTASSRRLSSVTTSSDDRGDGTVMLPEYNHYEQQQDGDVQGGGDVFYDRFGDDDVGHHHNDVGSPPDVANTGLTVNVINAMRYHAAQQSQDFFD